MEKRLIGRRRRETDRSAGDSIRNFLFTLPIPVDFKVDFVDRWTNDSPAAAAVNWMWRVIVQARSRRLGVRSWDLEVENRRRSPDLERWVSKCPNYPCGFITKCNYIKFTNNTINIINC